MDQIIVAIDFSGTSLHALKYGIMLANQMHAGVTMAWVDNQISTESVFSDGNVEVRDEAKRNFEEIMEQNRGLLSGGQLCYKLRKGKVYTEIALLAKQLEASIIITGTHGVTGFEEFWIGSNAFRIVMSSPCPVITIRPHYDFSNGIRNIVLPIDETRNTCQKVPFTAGLAKVFNARVHILALYSTTLKALNVKVDNCVADVEKHFSGAGIQCSVNALVAENVSRSTLEYAGEVDAELIAIMTEQETTASNILLGQYAQQMVDNSPIPVLCIHPGEIMKAN